MPAKLSKLEEKALTLLMQHEKGMLQSELWHKLGVTSREGSRIGIKLERKGYIKRVKAFSNDRWTRRLVPLIKQVDIKPLLGVPCPSCIYEPLCGPRSEPHYRQCVLLEEWLNAKSEAK
ncbi:MAG: Lrp/AsnC family transcriptional regulator [Candidatus Caldarchaeum sp.]